MFHSFQHSLISLTVAVLVMITIFRSLPVPTGLHTHWTTLHADRAYQKIDWRRLPQRHPVKTLTTLPNGPIKDIPRVQADFDLEDPEVAFERQKRLSAVKEAFAHSWEGYKENAWLQDEVAPLSGEAYNGFGGWGATLVDSLDTLWIMGLKQEFVSAVSALGMVDFTTTPLDTLNVFETTIRYLGGLLSAYDVSGHEYDILLEKAVELGDMLYFAFDTPDRMPITRWDWKSAALGGLQEAEQHASLAEVGSLTLEFTRLSQLTGDNKWYDAIARVTDTLHERQNKTRLYGLWPGMLDMRHLDFSKDTTFTFGGNSDSIYEYLPKQHILLGGRSDQYREMYLTAMASAKEHLFFQPLNPDDKSLLIPGTVKRHSSFDARLIPEGQHLSCFAGGMVALAAKAFGQPDELETARQLVEGCLWAYESMPSGIMPEVFTAVPCRDGIYNNCTWSQKNWYDAVDAHINLASSLWDEPGESAQQVIARDSLPRGMVEIPDTRYNLRPEAIESLFVLYRVTGDRTLQNKAWSMFQRISNVTRTEIAFASVDDVTQEQPLLTDSMESYWTAETLKYFYLIFSEPDVISLDDYVLNTEAHPLLRPK